MRQVVPTEVVQYLALSEVIKATTDRDNPDHLVYGMFPVRLLPGGKMPKGVTILCGNGKFGLYNANTKQLQVWVNKDFGQISIAPIVDDDSETEVEAQPIPLTRSPAAVSAVLGLEQK